MITLWGRTNSINVMKALWCLDELGLEYQRKDAGMAHGVVDEPHYRAINPNGRVPTLDDDGFTLWESNVIVRYLATRYDPDGLGPTGAQARALAEQWMDWQQTTLVPDITFIFWGLVRGRAENQDPALLAAASARLGNLWGMVERQLDGRDYLMGDRLTMADIPIGACAWRWANLDIERPALANVDAWFERLRSRPAFQKRVMLPLT